MKLPAAVEVEKTWQDGKRNTFILPFERYTQLAKLADANRRSVSQQASFLLEEKLRELESQVA